MASLCLKHTCSALWITYERGFELFPCGIALCRQFDHNGSRHRSRRLSRWILKNARRKTREINPHTAVGTIPQCLVPSDNSEDSRTSIPGGLWGPDDRRAGRCSNEFALPERRMPVRHADCRPWHLEPG